MDWKVGQVVFSKSGHDKGDALVIVSLDGQYVWVADGKRRKLAKPKKKKCIHLQPTSHVETTLAEKLENGSYLLDAEIAQVLKAYRK